MKNIDIDEIRPENKNMFLNAYVERFGYPDVLLLTTNYENEIFEKLMGKALQRNAPLTNEEIYKAFENVKYDLVEKNNKDKNVNEEQKEGAEMEENKIRTLLKRYGAEEKEIENFMEDLKDFKEDVEEDKPYLLNKENVELLKLTDEGKDLILNAPNMKKEELEEAIQNYIAKHKV